MDKRSYAAPVTRALFVLSRGYCYAPTCKVPVITLDEDGEPHTNVFIAHISAASDNGPRSDRNLTPERRKRFDNLLLLCKQHHDRVDGSETRDKYPVALLKEWKSNRELSVKQEIVGLGNLTEDRLDQMLISANRDVRAQLGSDIRSLSGISQDIRRLLIQFVDEPFRRPQFGPAELAALEQSANLAVVLPEFAPMLDRAAHAMIAMEDRAPAMHMFAEAIERWLRTVDIAQALNGNIRELEVVANQLASFDMYRMESAATSLRDAAQMSASHADMEYPRDYFEAQPIYANESTGLSWRTLAWGAAAGAALVLVIQLLGVVTFH